jgi:hypothetical protein
LDLWSASIVVNPMPLPGKKKLRSSINPSTGSFAATSSAVHSGHYDHSFSQNEQTSTDVMLHD